MRLHFFPDALPPRLFFCPSRFPSTPLFALFFSFANSASPPLVVDSWCVSLIPSPFMYLLVCPLPPKGTQKKKKEVSCRCSGRTFYFFFLIFASCLTFLPFFRLLLFCSCFHFYYCVIFLLYIRVSRYLQCSSARFFFFFFHASARRASFSFKHLLTFLSIYCLLVLFFFSIRLLTYRNTPKNGL